MASSLVKPVVDYKRDVDLGISKPESVTINRIDEVLTKLEALSGQVEGATAELNKIKAGTGLNIGVDLDEVVS